jgi:hypothetical protein
MLEPVVTLFMVSSGKALQIGYYLYVVNDGPVIDGNKCHLVVALCRVLTHPFNSTYLCVLL